MPRMEDLRIKKVSAEKPRAKVEPAVPREQPKERGPIYEDFPPEGYFASGKARSPYGLWVVAVFSVAFLLFTLSFLFTKAKITVTPKSAALDLNETFSAQKSGSGGSSESLPFDLVVIEGEESKEVVAGAPESVAISARGRVVIYNVYNSSPQPLLIDTRLEGSNGKIYKTDTRLTVPGMKGNAPGSVEVGIYAAEPGPEYNSGPLDFKIFGFKGTPKYAKFYARSVGDITGGFQGFESRVGEAERAQALGELKVGLQSKLFKRATDQLPEGFVFWKEASVLEVPEGNIKIETVGEVTTATVKGTLSGVLFDEKRLAKKIAETVLPQYDGAEVFMPSIQALGFTLQGDPLGLPDSTSIVFKLTGKATIVWSVDAERLAKDVLGKKKSQFNQILAGHPAISSAELVLRPFWKKSFPEKEKSIEVIVNYPK